MPEPTSAVRVGLCITELDPGGAERALVELATRIDRRQFAPVVYCLGPRPASNPSSLADRLEAAGISVHCFGARGAWHLPRLAGRLRRQLRSDAPRIVQTFLFHANVVGAWAARRAGVPHVVSGIRVAEQQAGWHLRIARWADRWVDRHVCVSQAVRDFTIERGGLPAHKLLVIPNGVDVDRFASAAPLPPASLGLSPNRRAIVTIGRLERQKGIDWLLEAMRSALAELPDHDLVIVGDGPARGELVRWAHRLGIDDRVRFLGQRADVPAILAAADLLVLASRWEGMPNAVLEAMAAGRPVVATDVQGVRELLGPLAAEQVVSREPGRMVARIAEILGDSELAARLGRENQARAQAEFRLDKMVAAYERLYGLLVARG